MIIKDRYGLNESQIKANIGPNGKQIRHLQIDESESATTESGLKLIRKYIYSHVADLGFASMYADDGREISVGVAPNGMLFTSHYDISTLIIEDDRYEGGESLHPKDSVIVDACDLSHAIGNERRFFVSAKEYLKGIDKTAQQIKIGLSILDIPGFGADTHTNNKNFLHSVKSVVSDKLLPKKSFVVNCACESGWRGHVTRAALFETIKRHNGMLNLPSAESFLRLTNIQVTVPSIHERALLHDLIQTESRLRENLGINARISLIPALENDGPSNALSM